MEKYKYITSGIILSIWVGSVWVENLNAQEKIKTTQENTKGFFTLGEVDGHVFFITPQGEPFFSLGINHIDPASSRYPENLHMWEEKYNGSTIEWLKKSVKPNLEKWGFNTMGWEQEVTVKKWQHSRSFTVDELKALDMPYCRMLPFIEAHQWEKHTVHYDFFSEDWIAWCEYVARAYCAEVKDDPNLIGYFFSDCPTWIHDRPENQWRGPMFDPEELESQQGRAKLSKMAKQYYKTIHDAIRKYDPNHLILGDRYEANAPIAMEVIEAAMPYVDVLSFQDFKDPATHLAEWYKKTGKPVLLADGSGIAMGEDNFKRAEGNWYKKQVEALFENKGCVGFHLCGAYQRNKARRKGLLDEQEHPDVENIALIQQTNEQIIDRIKKFE
ncbi:MAG: agarase [Bacteroidota bacterium]